MLSLTTSKGLKKEGLFLLSGEKLVREYCAAPQFKIIFEITTSAMTPYLDPAINVCLSSDLFNAIDVLGTHHNILVLQQPVIPVLDHTQITTYQPQGIEVVMPIGDPGNLGALIRSCEAFGVRRVILTEEAAHPFLPKSVKASAGSVLRMPILRGPAIAVFPDDCIALDMHGIAINDFVWPDNGLMVVGEEGPGFGGTAARFKRRIRIPTQGVESLNVVVAASIALSRR